MYQNNAVGQKRPHSHSLAITQNTFHCYNKYNSVKKYAFPHERFTNGPHNFLISVMFFRISKSSACNLSQEDVASIRAVERHHRKPFPEEKMSSEL